MSKQADEEQPSIYDILDPVVSEYASNKCWTNGFKSYEEVYEAAMEHLASQLTPNSVVEQRCLEARIDEHDVIDEYLGLDQDTPRGRRRIIFCEDLPVRQDTIKAQLTNLQNKEEEK